MLNNFLTAITGFSLYVAIRSLFRKRCVQFAIFEQNIKINRFSKKLIRIRKNTSMLNNFVTAITMFSLYVVIRSLFRKCCVRSEMFERNIKMKGFRNIMSISDCIGKYYTFCNNIEHKIGKYSKMHRIFKMYRNFKNMSIFPSKLEKCANVE